MVAICEIDRQGTSGEHVPTLQLALDLQNFYAFPVISALLLLTSLYGVARTLRHK
jgi:hypothetical protein